MRRLWLALFVYAMGCGAQRANYAPPANGLGGAIALGSDAAQTPRVSLAEWVIAQVSEPRAGSPPRTSEAAVKDAGTTSGSGARFVPEGDGEVGSLCAGAFDDVGTGSACMALPGRGQTLTGRWVSVRLSERPDTRIAVNFDSLSGHSLQLSWDPQQSESLTKTIRLPLAPEWHVSIEAPHQTIPTNQGKDAVFHRYAFKWSRAKTTAGAESLRGSATTEQLDVGSGSGSAASAWVPVNRATDLDVYISLVMRDVDTRSVAIAAAAVGAPRGLDSAVPDAVKDTLQLLAEIAVERAKAEGIRIFKDHIVTYVCDELTVDHVFPNESTHKQELLPSTCGQLRTLRVTDLGSSATGLLDALREDLVDTVMPLLLDNVKDSLGQSFGPQTFAAANIVVGVVKRAIRRGLSASDLTLAVRSLVDELAPTNNTLHKWRPAIEVALVCAEQTCTLADLDAFLVEVENADPNGHAPHVQLIELAEKIVAVLDAPQNTDPQVLAGQLIDVILDLVRDQCVSNEPGCVASVNAIRDVAVGLVERDYLRAIGGVDALMRTAGFGKTLKGKPLELLTTIATYVQTYRDTQNKDAATAHQLRKEALESLIDAGTDRTNREGDTIVSLGTSVGFALGGEHILYGLPMSASTAWMHDLRLPLGLTVQHLPRKGATIQLPLIGWRFDKPSWLLHASFADLAQFVSSPVAGKDTTKMQETTWSDFVSPGIQLGLRFGSNRVPLVVGFDASYAPRVTLQNPDGTQLTTSVVRYGLFLGFNVAFFDLN